jgi:conjugal transfer/entry exclusion protein
MQETMEDKVRDLREIAETFESERKKIASEVRDKSRESQEAMERLQATAYQAHNLLLTLSEKLLAFIEGLQSEPAAAKKTRPAKVRKK